MRMRFIHSVKQISTHLEERVLPTVSRVKELEELGEHDIADKDKGQLVAWGFHPHVTNEEVSRELEVIEYIYCLFAEIAKDYDREKPSVAEFVTAFTRHLNYLKRVHSITPNTKVQTGDWRKYLVKQAEACEHYISLMQQPEYYKSLPSVVYTLENKYPHSQQSITRQRRV